MTSRPHDGAVSAAIGLANVPEAVRRAATIADPSYVDLFVIRTAAADASPPEAWARAILEQTPTGRSAPELWRSLGLRLGPRDSPAHVQGWAISAHSDDWIRLETTSWYMTAHAIVHVSTVQVSLALFLRYDRRIAAVLWPPVAVMHRRAVPVMLRQAVQLMTDSE